MSRPTKERIYEAVAHYLEKESLFIVEVVWSNKDDITVSIDSMESVAIWQCEEVSRLIERELEKSLENFSITVTSHGLSSPFKMVEHYQKNLTREIEIILKSGEKFKATLLSANQDSISIEREVKRTKKGGPQEFEIEQLEYKDIKSAQLVIKFK
ncbi:MAG: hypothetical protein WC960_05380 [Bacteroidales bacterium]